MTTHKRSELSKAEGVATGCCNEDAEHGSRGHTLDDDAPAADSGCCRGASHRRRRKGAHDHARHAASVDGKKDTAPR